jgi:hypothetical protein
MTYYIETDINGLPYWVKVLDLWSSNKKYQYELQGLMDNATEFINLDEAQKAMDRLKCKTDLVIKSKKDVHG